MACVFQRFRQLNWLLLRNKSNVLFNVSQDNCFTRQQLSYNNLHTSAKTFFSRWVLLSFAFGIPAETGHYLCNMSLIQFCCRRFVFRFSRVGVVGSLSSRVVFVPPSRLNSRRSPWIWVRTPIQNSVMSDEEHHIMDCYSPGFSVSYGMRISRPC